ncbi:MAG: hypothetical protein ABI602_04495 [Candidatus Saccharibacteria bacterium]
MHKLFAGSLGLLLFAVMPFTTNYKLNSYGFGSGGGTASTANYALEGKTGEISGQPTSTANYKILPAYIGSRQANVPLLASLDNNGGIYYNKLHFVIDTQSNPTDAKYALEISTDNFVADTHYVKNDLTVGTTLSTTDFQTYTTWGGAGGANIIGLAYNQQYWVRVSATQGSFTQSAYGPTPSTAANTATTANPSITFNLTTTSQALPPYSISIGTLSLGAIGTSADTVNLGLTTNASNGANLYILSKNSGLKSTSTANTIASASVALGSVGSGYGVQSSSASQSSGGPLTAVSPYAGTSDVVGVVDSLNRSLYTSSAPITGGAASFLFKAKAATTVVAANDYTDMVTIVAAGNF